ncbi:MAG: sulfurtransferase [Chloroflexota bacterium]
MTQANTVPTLVTADWLAEHLNDPNVLPVDTRWYLGEPGRGRQEYHESHIPGAPHLDIDQDLAAPPFHGPGRHPLPPIEEFAVTVGRAGISPETHVVIYDSVGGAFGARLWWMLRYLGHKKVSMLDGGWQAWQATGHPIETEAPNISPTTFTPRPRPEVLVNADDVERLRHTPGVLLIDARNAERYEGRSEPIDSHAGHIPGARQAFFGENLNPDGTFKSPEALRERFTSVGANQADKVICYCGSGVTAAHNILALELAGFPEALLYEGSWSDWSSDPARPAATGSEDNTTD